MLYSFSTNPSCITLVAKIMLMEGCRTLLSAFVFVVHVKENSRKQDQPLDDLLPINVNAEDGHTVVHDTHDERADDGPNDGTDPTAGGRAPDEDGGDDI